MDLLEMKSLDVAPPTEVYVRATVTSSQQITIPATMIGKFVTFEADTSAVFILFGTNPTASASAVSTGTPPAITLAATSSFKIEAGGSLTVKIPSTVTTLAHISADTSGFLRFYNSTGVGEP